MTKPERTFVIETTIGFLTFSKCEDMVYVSLDACTIKQLPVDEFEKVKALFTDMPLRYL